MKSRFELRPPATISNAVDLAIGPHVFQLERKSPEDVRAWYTQIEFACRTSETLSIPFEPPTRLIASNLKGGIVGKKLRVGNLGSAIDAAGLGEIFAACGSVATIRLVEDQFNGKSRGFGFVEMSSEQEAAECIAKLHGSKHSGRVLNVTEAPPEKSKGRGGRSAT